MDFNQGPEAAQQIILVKQPCTTVTNGSGMKCTCDYECANYWLRASGFRTG